MKSNQAKKQQQQSSLNMENQQLSDSQMKHLIRLIRQRYISPYKIMYMISQQEADFFKKRNQSCGCCSSSSITIPKDQMTRTQSYLNQTIQDCLKIKNLDKILSQLSDKFNNIVKSGEKANLKVDDQVEKFIVQKALSQGFNLHIYQLVMEKLKKEVKSVANSAMLWATPQTWYSRFPNIPLNFLLSETLTNLTNKSKGYGFQPDFLKDYKENLFKELKLLQKDGKFEELLWSKQHQKIRNDLKIMKDPQNYSFDGTQESYYQGQLIYPNLKKALLTLRSIPFQLNQKLNAFCTLSQNNQITFFKSHLNYKVKDESKICKFSTFCLIGQNTIKCSIVSKQNGQKIEQKTLKNGQLVIIQNSFCQIELSGKVDTTFLFRSWISTLQKKN